MNFTSITYVVNLYNVMTLLDSENFKKFQRFQNQCVCGSTHQCLILYINVEQNTQPCIIIIRSIPPHRVREVHIMLACMNAGT